MIFNIFCFFSGWGVSVVDFASELRDHSVQQHSSSQDHLDQNRLTFRLLPTLVMSIGILVLLSVGSVLIVNWIADRRIVRNFFQDRAPGAEY